MNLLVLPGMDGSASLRSAFVAAVAPAVQTKVVAYPPDRPLDYAQLEALVRAEIPQQPFVLVGESFSGPIAISLAATNPPGLRGLVLAGSFARMPIAMPRLLAWLAAIIPLAVLPSRCIVTALLGRTAPDGLGNCLLAVISSVRSSVWRSRLRAVVSVDVVAHLSLIRVPVLYLRPAADRMVPRTAYETIVGANPNVRVVELEGPHFILVARPTESAAEIRRFMREVGFAF